MVGMSKNCFKCAVEGLQSRFSAAALSSAEKKGDHKQKEHENKNRGNQNALIPCDTSPSSRLSVQIYRTEVNDRDAVAVGKAVS